MDQFYILAKNGAVITGANKIIKCTGVLPVRIGFADADNFAAEQKMAQSSPGPNTIIKSMSAIPVRIGY